MAWPRKSLLVGDVTPTQLGVIGHENAEILVPLWCYTISGALHPFRAGAMLSKWCNAP